MRRAAIAPMLLCLGSAAQAQTVPPIVAPSSIVPPQGCAFRRGDGSTAICSPSDPLPIAAVPVDGGLLTVGASSSTGTLLPGRPSGARTVALYLGTSDSVTYTIATTQPATAPTATITVAGGSFAVWSETLGPGTNLYVTAVTGAPRYRWQ